MTGKTMFRYNTQGLQERQCSGTIHRDDRKDNVQVQYTGMTGKIMFRYNTQG